MFVGMPAALLLHEFGSQVWHALGVLDLRMAKRDRG
jgi:hypothetical protein